MAKVGDEEVQVEPGEVLVERRVVPAGRDRTGPLALIIVIAFIITCIYVFWGERLGLREPAPQTAAHQQIVR
jgi:hypothetical protein